MLNTTGGPTDDVRVRQALAYAIDKQAIINDILKGTGVPATRPVPSVIDYAYNKNVQTYAYDPDKAKQLLTDAGYPNGFYHQFLGHAVWIRYAVATTDGRGDSGDVCAGRRASQHRSQRVGRLPG